MDSLSKVLPWLEENVEPMRHSRRKTLADIVEGAMCLQGSGVLALAKIGAYCIGLITGALPKAIEQLARLPA